MSLVPSTSISNNHKLYFSKDELSKILNLYSLGVSNGSWKDYSIFFAKNEANFCIYKHTLASPEWVLNKFLERKRKKVFYKLMNKNYNNKFDNLDSLIRILSRKNIYLAN